MSARLRTPDAYRETLAELLGAVQIQAELGAKYAAIGDDVGLAYSVRKLTAYNRTALNILGDLRELKDEQHRRQHSRQQEEAADADF